MALEEPRYICRLGCEFKSKTNLEMLMHILEKHHDKALKPGVIIGSRVKNGFLVCFWQFEKFSN